LHVPEAETWADFEGTGQLERRYYNASFLPMTDGQGQVTGLLNAAFDVTAQVAARQQVQELNEELASINEELRASNEEYLATNTALSESQLQFRQLNQELEARERRYQLNNEAYRAWVGQDPAALLGQPVRAVVGEQAYAATAGYMDRALAGEWLSFDATMPTGRALPGTFAPAMCARARYWASTRWCRTLKPASRCSCSMRS
jgi:PAS domain-containing protein